MEELSNRLIYIISKTECFNFIFLVPSQAPNVSEIFNTSSTSIRVTWEPLSPHFVQGRLLGYRVVYRQVDGENWEKWKAITTGNKELGTSITGLKKYGAYVVQVGAFTRKGNGLLSKGYMLRTDEDGRY